MATPNPTPPTHQSSTSAAPKRHRHRRHAQHQPASPEEPSSPAKSGRVDGLAHPQARSHPNVLQSGKNTPPAATCGAGTVGPAVEGERTSLELLESSKNSKRPPVPAVTAVPGKSVHPAVTVSSGGLAPNGRRGIVEGTEGLAGLLPGSAGLAMPGNAGPSISADILPVSAPKLFDSMPERNPNRIPVGVVLSEAGEVWEKAPEWVVMEGSTIRAVYSSPINGSPQAAPGASSLGQAASKYSNAGHPQRSGLVEAHPRAREARQEGLGRPGSTPGRAGRAGDGIASLEAAGACGFVQQGLANHNAAKTHRSGMEGGPADDVYAAAGGAGMAGSVPGSSGAAAGLHPSATQPVQRAVSVSLPRATISSSGGLEGSLSAPWQAGSTVYNCGTVGSEEGTSFEPAGGSNMVQIRTDCSQYAADLGEVHAATDSIYGQNGSKEKGGTLEGRVGYVAGVVRGADSSSLRNAAIDNRANQNGSAANAATIGLLLCSACKLLAKLIT